MSHHLRSLSVLLLCLLAQPAGAISGNDQVQLAGSGRFAELRRQLESDEAKGPLKSRDLHALCFAYAKTKHYSKLLPCLDRLQQNVAQGDKRTRLFGLDDVTPAIEVMRADAYVELGQYPQALQAADQALAWYQRENSDDRDILINSLAAKALAATLSGDRAAGERFAAELDKVDVSWPHGDFKTIKSMAVARVYLALGQYQRTYDAIVSDSGFAVRSFLDNLVSLAYLQGENNWLWQELPRSYMLNKALFGLGKTGEAKAGYDQLLAIPQLPQNGEIYWLILYDRGNIAEQEGAIEQALGFYRQAIDVIESQRATIHTEANKIGFVGDKQDVYSRMIAGQFRQNRSDTAFEYIERSKSRALVDLLATKQDFALPGAAKANTGGLLASLNQSELQARLQDPLNLAASVARSRNPSNDAVTQLRHAAPELASLVSVSSMPAAEIRAQLGSNEVLIEYFLQGNSLFAFVVSRDKIKAQQLEASGLEESVRLFRSRIEERSANSNVVGQQLYQRLIKPLEGDIRGKELIFVPHGILHYLPFAALHNGQGYLIEHFSLRNLPSASVLKYLKPARLKRDGSILILGNPDLGDPRFDLPDAQVEAQDIAKQMPKPTLLVRKAASEKAFRQLAPKFPYIHIASHGQLSTDEPLKSALLLASDGEYSGNLDVSKLYSLQLNADLVTLSACETGLGKIARGDDVVGLTRGFLYAGSSSVVASLWQVDDFATSMLMTRFYNHLGKANKRDALRQAQQETRKQFPHPYFWAAFYLTGNAN